MPKHGEISDFWLRLCEMIDKPPNVRQVDVAKLFHVGQSAVTKWKTGKDTPALPRARDMAAEYGVSVDWLLDGRGPKFPGDSPDPELARLLEIWPYLAPNTRRDVVKYAIYQRTI